jgi:Asp-tRNA(Asn)/Glu-tRNA(Gln) amidotransferase A subunit family amidase
LDQLPSGFDAKRLNGVAQGAYKLYDADAMHGLPVGVQIVGKRLEEEKVLSMMATVEEALQKQGKRYEGINIFENAS